MTETTDEPEGISVVGEDPCWRVQRTLRLMPRTGPGVPRRAIVLAVLTWLPMAVWAAIYHRVSAQPPDVTFVNQFGLHVRFLVAIPLMIVAEGTVHRMMRAIVPYFYSSGVVGESLRGRFSELMRSTLRLRNHPLPWIIFGAVAFGLPAVSGDDGFTHHELAWDTAADGSLGFGGLWFLYVARPIFLAVLLFWSWRVVMLVIFLARFSRLPLSLVATHPDRIGGLGFLDFFPAMFPSLIFALSALMASQWGHEVLFHDAQLADLQLEAISFVVVMLLIFLAPFCVFLPPLLRAKWNAELEYGALIGRHDLMIRRRWILDEPVQDEKGLLGSPELGPLVDVHSVFQAIEQMRVLPIRLRGLVFVLVPLALPLLLVVLVRVPVREILAELLKALL